MFKINSSERAVCIVSVCVCIYACEGEYNNPLNIPFSLLRRYNWTPPSILHLRVCMRTDWLAAAAVTTSTFTTTKTTTTTTNFLRHSPIPYLQVCVSSWLYRNVEAQVLILLALCNVALLCGVMYVHICIGTEYDSILYSLTYHIMRLSSNL